MSDRTYIEENRSQRDRLRRMVASLSDDDMAQQVYPGWNVSVVLAHMAYLDRMWLQRFEDWDRVGKVALPNIRAALDAGLNDGPVPWFLAMSYDDVRREGVAAAGAFDTRTETLSDAVVNQILEARPRTIARAVHRREHIADIENALGRTFE